MTVYGGIPHIAERKGRFTEKNVLKLLRNSSSTGLVFFERALLDQPLRGARDVA
jgi:hypothetical protein